MLVILFGAFLKITHFKIMMVTANPVLITGMAIEAVAVLLLIYKAIADRRKADITNLR